jgi:flagellar protein FlaG
VSPSPAHSAPPSDSVGTVQTRQADEKALQQAVDKLQRKVQISASNLHFSIDHETGRTVVRVTDVNTQEVIRQIPPEEILHLDQALDRVWGLLLHKEG